MAKDITLKNKNGETRYPKSVTALIYENGTGKTLQTIIDEMRQVDSATDTRTQHFKADVNNLDTLKNKTDIGLYNYVGTGWRGSVSVCYDSADNVSQVALSSSTPSYNGNTLTWLSAQPCAMARTYTNGAWSHWEKVGAPVVNDLTTGGTDKALSAEMGKTLKEGLDALGPKLSKIDPNITDNTALLITGEETTAENRFVTDFISVSPNDVVLYKGGFSASQYSSVGNLVAFGNDKTTRVDYWGAQVGERSITIPANAAYIRATFAKGTEVSLKINGASVDLVGELGRLSQRIEQTNANVTSVQGEVQSVKDQIGGLVGNYTNGKAVNESTGEEVDATGFIVTDFIPVTPGDSVVYDAGFTGSSYADRYGLVAYKSDKTRRNSWTATVAARSITIPSNAAYIRATFSLNYANSSLKINDTEVPLYGTIGTIEQQQSKLAEDVADVQQDVDDVKGDVQSVQDELSKMGSMLIEDKAINGADGSIVSAEGYIATDLIPASPNDEVRYLGGFVGTEVGYGLVAYKSDKTTRVNHWSATTYERTITLPANTAYIRATFKAPYNDGTLVINNESIPLEGTIAETVKKYLPEEDDDISSHVAMNVFGDVLPPLFKQRFYPADKDMLIVCQGDSITGLVENTSLQDDPTHSPAGQQYRGWVALLQERINKTKLTCDRLDSQRDSEGFFTKTGTWQNVIDIERTEIYHSDGTASGQERSKSALTFQCADTSAAMSFVFDADIYEKCNIIYSKEPDGVLTKIVITEGNGKMLASLDRTTWVEANGLQVTQRTFSRNGTDYTGYSSLADFTNACAVDGIATRQRHRRIWLKKVAGVTGEINITYQRDNSTQYTDSYMYVWGVERYSGNAVFFDNVGRGGRETKYLAAAVSDVFDRNPDLCIFEMPLANETEHTMTALKSEGWYDAYFLGSGDNSFKTRSNNYTDMPVIVILPHGRSAFFDTDNNAIAYSDQPAGEPVAYNVYKQMYGWLMAQMAQYSNVKFINLYDQLINEILAKGYTITAGTSGAEYAITADGIHLNDYGSNLWMLYLAPIFQ